MRKIIVRNVSAGLLLLLSGCNPYVLVVSQSYGAATDARSVGTQLSDDEIEASIKAQLVASPVPGTVGIKAYSRQGVVVLTGVVPSRSSAGTTAVNIARTTAGVVRVETFFVDAQPSLPNDLELAAKIKAAFVADPNLLSERVSVVVYGGNAVLIGVVADPAHLDEFVNDARSVDGVTSVRSYIQLIQ